MTHSSDNGLIVTHQSACGVTLGDVISAIGPSGLVPNLSERPESVVRVS